VPIFEGGTTEDADALVALIMETFPGTVEIFENGRAVDERA
jgi:hypothetical protein